VFVLEGDHLRVEHSGPLQYGETTSQVQLSLDGRIVGDEVYGSIGYRERITPASGAAFECGAGNIHFSVRR
jgi:hypothetical protein